MSEDVSYEAEVVIEQLGQGRGVDAIQIAKLQSALMVSLQGHQRDREELTKLREELAKLRNEAAKA